MATFVDNLAQYLEPGLTGIVHGYRTSSNSLSYSLLPRFPLRVDDSSSEDEAESDRTYRIRDINDEVEPSILDSRDEGTADSWVERNPSLIRLTGKHPFNCEPPLSRLMHHGFITPATLHYVRNHGHVPKGTWEDWTVEVTGLVKRPTRFTMDQLVNELLSCEFPVTLVCAGNRRKEQNMVKQTIGFSWGAAGVSTSVWRGVRLRDVLRRCGIYSRRMGALNVCFEGAEDLPGGGGSKYGTSMKKEIAMDPSRDIILAYMQNGELLKPDHGFPVRMIIPGFIGGRMVKWLKRIIVTTKESDNYYHYNDNRVLPSHVDAELANTEAWWYKPEYIINELNINSVITTPCHEEILPRNFWTTRRRYKLKGYAYTGGGRKITRVEVTLDGGESWIVCQLDIQEKPNKYGKYWCWCFWSLEVEVPKLLGSKEIAVRAWDEALNTQPEKLIWNVMGMMNNCWFKVKMNERNTQKGEIGIMFEHPTQPANQPGGWMAQEKHLKTSESNLEPLKNGPSVTSNVIPMAEVKKHNSVDSAWIVVHGHIYDCTRFLKDHPGGSDSILINAGTDCTEEFDAIHSGKARKMLEDYQIGKLITTVPDSVPDSSNVINNVALIPGEKIKCKLISKTSVSHNVRVFRFALPSEDQVLGLPIGKHIYVSATIDGKLCMRAYTPTSAIDEVGYFDLIIKVYFKGVNPKFPNGGLLSQYLNSLPLGATLDFKGPLGHIEYTGRGNFTVHGKHKFAKKLAMIAGGTGITPIYQVIQSILKDPEDETEMYLVYANQTEDDILLRDGLDSWVVKHERFKVWYVIGESIREGWKYSIGSVTESVLREHLPEGSSDTLALACGPPGMIQFVVMPELENMNHDVKNSLLVF
ncbi:nitrate reductase [NADH]-like [Macadamia integrifolia]|uniref:nitrate reductase [NADH]-like n=1 Tax=Macadamia integrifolia TaxID=60698 RepID=UPI001C501A15|nr:nitrate reductase [NADH]-like [Macadamia integrifolia]